MEDSDLSVTAAIVVPVHNGLPQLRVSLPTLRWARGVEGLTVIVVDGGSTDGTAAYLAEEEGWVRVVRGGASMWWAAATNAGCRHAAALGVSHLCLLNHDCEWDERSYRELAEAQARHANDIVCSRVVVRGRDRLLYAGGTIAWTGKLVIRGFMRDAAEAYPEGQVAWCGGMGVLFPTWLWQRLEGFDERAFPHYHADADFCLRARRFGSGVFFCSASTVVNDRASTGVSVPRSGATVRHLLVSLTSRKSPFQLRETVRFYGRHARWRAPLALSHLYGIHLGSSLKRIVRSAVEQRGGRDA